LWQEAQEKKNQEAQAQKETKKDAPPKEVTMST